MARRNIRLELRVAVWYARVAVKSENVRVPLVGRAVELEAVELFGDRVARGAHALFLEGEPGIGKTHVWSEGVRLLRGRDSLVLRTRPAGADSEFAFAALGDLLRDVIDGVVAELPGPQRRAVSAALLLEDDTGAIVDRHAVGAAVLGTLRLLARERSVVLAVDDAQWLDSASRDVLTFALRRLEDEAVGVFATVRVSPEASAEGVIEAMPEHRVDRVRLGPLTVASLYEIVRLRLGLSLSRGTLLRLHECSAGSPFYALEIARMLCQSAEEPEPGDPLPVPADLRDLLRARIAQLPQRSAEVLLGAAALARPTVAVLERAFPDADDAMAGAVAAGVVETEGDRVRFTHPLFGSVHYESAPRRAREMIHAQLAAVVDGREERARHRALASDEPKEAVAAELEGAAREAYRRGALAAAAELAELSLARTERESGRSVQRALLAAELDFALGQPSHARALLEETLERTTDANQRAELLLAAASIASEHEGVAQTLALVDEGVGPKNSVSAVRTS